MIHNSVRERQGEVQKTGDKWEEEVIARISPDLALNNLAVVKGREKQIRMQFWEQLYVPTKKGGVWGDIDLIVYNKMTLQVIAVISCKVSLHGRLTESLFYWLLFKDKLKRPFKFVFATNDKGRGQGEWNSEWGSNEKPTKDRKLAETYTDGVYIQNRQTILGGGLFPLDNLARDIIDWDRKLSG